MADPFSLFGGRRSKSTLPARPTVRPGFFDTLFNRGSFTNEYASRRGEIIGQSLIEKKRLRKDVGRERREYEIKLRKDNKKLYQDFDIKLSMRGNKEGYDERQQKNARTKAWKAIQKQLRRQQRREERAIEHRRDEAIKKMRDELWRQSTSVTDTSGSVELGSATRTSETASPSHSLAA